MNEMFDKIMAIRLATHSPGRTRKCGSKTAEKMADAVGGKASRFRNSRVLFGKKDLAEITAVINKIGKVWRGYTQPLPENDGVRLAPLDAVPIIKHAFEQAQLELAEAVASLNQRRAEIMQEAAVTLGDEFHASDYPSDFSSVCSIEMDYPVIAPDERLKHLDPALYEQKVQERVAQVTAGMEKMLDAFIVELSKLVERMVEILTPDDSGKPKRFRKDTLETFEFLFDRFSMLTKDVQGVRKDNLQAVVEKAKDLLNGVTADKMRTDTLLQQELKDGFSQISKGMAALVETLPDRAISFEDDDEDTDGTDG